jgi:hypothetical protein
MAGARGSARRELVGRLFGARNRRRGPRLGPAVRATLAVVLPGAAGLAGLAFAWPYAAAAARRHPYFAVREVIVRQTHHVPADEIRRVAGIEPGMSVWDVDGPSAEARLRDHDWIRAAHVRRELPHRVVIQVQEERPVAILAMDDGKAADYYVAAHGRVFARVGAADPRDFPYVTGLGSSDLGEADVLGPRALRRALALVRIAGRGSAGLGAVSEVHVDRTRGLTLMPERPAVPIELGWTGFAEKLARLPRVLALWAGREGEIATLDLLFDDEVIVRTRMRRT